MSPQCTALTKAGGQCRNRPVPESDRCHVHFGSDDASDSETQGPNEKAVLRTLRALGVTPETDAARFQLLRSLAAAVDATPTKAALWTAYSQALSDLTAPRQGSDGDQSLKEAEEALRSAG